MIKLSTLAFLFSALAGAALAETYPRYEPPLVTYALPPVVVESHETPPSLLYEGRSTRLSEPSAFFNATDNMGYPTGLPQNPQN